jgi:hypothetical protein
MRKAELATCSTIMIVSAALVPFVGQWWGVACSAVIFSALVILRVIFGGESD